MSADERILRLENAMATLAELAADRERRVSRLEEALVTLVELVRSHNESMDESRVAHGETDRKIAVLADAQIRTEDALKQLAEAQAHTDRRLDALIDIVRGERNGQS
jgi:chromosome segregation ATPase